MSTITTPAFTTESGALDSPPLLHVENLSKFFGEVRANEDLNFTVRPSEVHVLLGENGAGKSTLVKSLYGVHRPDSGTMTVLGKAVRFSSPSDARAVGIGMVFQDMRLVPALTVWENIALHLMDTPVILRPRELRSRIRELSRSYGLSVDPDRVVAGLSIGEWQRVELLKVLMGGVKVLVLDEPTSVLTPQEVDGLFAVLDELRGTGIGIVLITHKLREVRAIADRVTVLRAGRSVLSDADPRALSDDDLVAAMVGEHVDQVGHVASHATDTVAAQLEGVSVAGTDGAVSLADVTLSVHAGEIVGVAGVAGSGQELLTDVLAGIAAPDSGTVQVGGKTPHPAPLAMRHAGVVQVCPDPVQQFVIPGLSVADHVALWNLGAQDQVDRRHAAKDLARRDDKAGLGVVAPTRRLDSLSGGNIQRVVLTLALTSDAMLTVVSYPTRGLDILTTQRTRALMRERAQAGQGVVLVSEDLDELLAVADRILVLHEGRVAGIVDASTATRHQLGALMSGQVAV